MAKSLGQIHTVNYELIEGSVGIATGQNYLIDLPGQLTSQLQHMVRMMNSFKVVGIDLALGQPAGGADPVDASVDGQIYYYAPTAGRVEALKHAFAAVMRMMKLSGVDPSHAITYDFRPPMLDPANCVNGDDFLNQASIEDNGLASCLANSPVGSSSIFGIYNQGILPRQVPGDPPGFEEGFDIGLRTNADSADWTLNEGIYLQALTAPVASEEMESIPFNLAFSNEVDDASSTAFSDTFLWRPDPALYLSVLTGQLVVSLDQVEVGSEGEQEEVLLDLAVHVAGWKSILRDHRRKRRSSKKGGKKRGRKRHSKK